MDAVTRLSHCVSAVCNVSVLGGRCTVVDSSRCILYDCSNWSSEMSACILEEFPTCSITVTSVDTSVSGFVVVFLLHERGNRFRTTFLVLLLFVVLVVVSVYVFRTVSGVLPLFPVAVGSWISHLGSRLGNTTRFHV